MVYIIKKPLIFIIPKSSFLNKKLLFVVTLILFNLPPNLSLTENVLFYFMDLFSKTNQFDFLIIF